MKKIINLAPIIFISALTGDFIVSFLLAFFYEGYNHIEMVMSELGSLKSPVSFWMSAYWVLYGFAIILFGFSFYRTYRQKKIGRIIGYLFIIVGIGVGLFSGFPMDSRGTDPTWHGKLHDIGNGIGFLAIFMTPFFLFKFFKNHKKIQTLLIAIQLIGLLFLGLFIASENGAGNGISQYVGLWQRLYLACYYAIFSLLAVKMRKILYDTSDNTAYPARTFPKALAQILISLFFLINQGGETKTSDTRNIVQMERSDILHNAEIMKNF